MRFLLMDFGTTSTKTALVDMDSGVFSGIRNFAALPNCATHPGRYEIAPGALHERFDGICREYATRSDFAGIAVCSEQNGYLCLDEQDRPLTPYVSWKDERSTEPIDGVSTYDLVTQRLGARFHAISGWRPGPNLPIMGITHLGRAGLLPSRCRVITLPEWLEMGSGQGRRVVHDTMLHCLGFYDVRERRTSDDLTSLVADVAGVRCEFAPTVPAGMAGGSWSDGSRSVPVYVGVGDHQCSVLGAGNVPRETLSLNLGTGSQVASIDAVGAAPECELRPYFDGRLLPAITRIPAGRVLAQFIGFLEEVARGGSPAVGQPADFWSLFRDLSENEVRSSTLELDLALFGSAWTADGRGRGGGRIGNISDGTWGLRNYLASLMRCWLAQYADAMRRIDPERVARRCLLSGGLARRLPALAQMLPGLTGYETWPACEVDESLLGLRTVALVAAGRAATCLEAQAVFGRECCVVGDV